MRRTSTRWSRSGQSLRPGILAVVTLALIAACGGGGGAGGESKDSAVFAEPDLEQGCAGAPVADFGNETLCADSGLRAAEALAIVNWGGYVYPDDDFGIDEMVALFGAEAVCATYVDSQCDERADAALRRTELNQMIAGGRCEGLTTLAMRLTLALATSREVGGVDEAAQLTPQTGGVVDVIDYWWATQFNEGVIEETAKYRDLDLEGIVGAVVRGLEGREGFTMGVYFEGMGHSLLPVAVTSPERGVFNVWTWDSNNPRKLTPVRIDTAGGVWAFENASANPQFPATTWSGERGSIDLTPMSVRAGGEKASFGGTGTGKIRVSAVPIGRGMAQAVVTLPNGERAGTVDGVTVSEIPGAIVQIHRDGLASGVTILLPRDVGEVTVEADALVDDGTAEALITIATEGRGITQVSTRAKDQNKESRVQLQVNTDAAGIEVEPQDLASAIVSIGEDRVSVEVPVAPGETLEVQRPEVGGGTVEVDLQRDGQPVLRDVVTAPATGIERVVFDGQNLSKTLSLVPPKPVEGAASLVERVKKSQVSEASTTSATVATTTGKQTSTVPPKATSTSTTLKGTATTVKATTTTSKLTSTTLKPLVTTTTAGKATTTTVKSLVSNVKSTTTVPKVTSTTLKPLATTTTAGKATTTTVKTTTTVPKVTSTTLKPLATTTTAGKVTTTTVKTTTTVPKVTSTTLKPLLTTSTTTVVTTTTTTVVATTTVKAATTTTTPLKSSSTSTTAKYG